MTSEGWMRDMAAGMVWPTMSALNLWVYQHGFCSLHLMISALRTFVSLGDAASSEWKCYKGVFGYLVVFPG